MKNILLATGLATAIVGTISFATLAESNFEDIWAEPDQLPKIITQGAGKAFEKTRALWMQTSSLVGLSNEPVQTLAQSAKSEKEDHGDEHKHDDEEDHNSSEKEEHGHSEDEKHQENKDGVHEHSDGHEEDNHEEEKGHDHDEVEQKEEDSHDHAENEKHGASDEDLVRLTASQMTEFGIAVGAADFKVLGEIVTLPGEVKYNGDRLAHVVPRVEGIVTKVFGREGEHVKAGDVLAVLESRELADLKGEFLAALGRLDIVQASYDREARLRAEKISTEQAFLDAKGVLTEAKIVLRTARQKLFALGLNADQLNQIARAPDGVLTHYNIISPFDGLIVKRHITLGETSNSENQAFIIADMTDLWVDLQVFPRDLAKVRKGQGVTILDEDGIIIAKSDVSFVAAQIQEETRTAVARISVPASAGLLRPGMFVTGRIDVGGNTSVVTIPKTAPQIINDKTVVFLETENGFKAQEISLGRVNGASVEVRSGLTPNTEIVTAGAFVLKAQLSKAQFGDGHNH